MDREAILRGRELTQRQRKYTSHCTGQSAKSLSVRGPISITGAHNQMDIGKCSTSVYSLMDHCGCFVHKLAFYFPQFL